ncbi:11609_t:CDS:2, partial [Dentiscutata heterogama]
LTDKRRKTKANKSTTPKDIADTPRLKRRTLPLLENNRSKENILCDIKKSSDHGEEHYIDIDIASSPNMLDRVNQVWGIIEEAIIKLAKQNLPNKKIRPSKRA